MNDTTFVSIHAGLYSQYNHEKQATARLIKDVRNCSDLDKDYFCGCLKYWIWAQRETRREFRKIRADYRKGGHN